MASVVVNELINRVRWQADEQSMERTRGAIDAVKSIAAAAAAVIGGKLATSLYTTTTAFAQTADESIKTARNLGLTAEAYQELTYAAGLSGVSQDRLRDGLKDLQKNSQEAARGSKELAKEFQRLGINVNQFAKYSADQKLAVLSHYISKIENPAERARVKMKLLGESGVYMGNLLDNGAEAIAGMRKEAQDLGLVIGSDVAVKAEAMNDALDKSRMIVKALSNPIAEELIPVFTDVANEVTKFVKSLDREQIKAFARDLSGFVKLVLFGLIDALRWARDNSEILKAALVVIAGGAVIAGMTKLVGLVKVLAGLANLANLKFLAGAVVIGLMLLAAEDLYGFLEGRPSVIGDIIGNPKDIEIYRNAIDNFLKEITKVFSDSDFAVSWIKRNLSEAHEMLVKLLVPLFQDTADRFVRWQESLNFTDWIKRLKKDLVEAFEFLSKFFEALGRRIIDTIAKAIKALGETIALVGKGGGSISDRAAALAEGAKRLASFTPIGMLGGTAYDMITGATGTGSASKDAAARVATAQSMTSNQSISVAEVNVNVPNTVGSPAEVGAAAQDGIVGAISGAQLRQASRTYDGAMT